MILEERNRYLKEGRSGKVRLMFQDEAGFGRISQPRSCWITGKVRPLVPAHHIRQYRYAYGAVDPLEGEKFFFVAPCCNSQWMNVFFSELSNAYPDDFIILVMDNATWHRSQTLQIPPHIRCVYLPPYTPEMNPIEQVWKELRKSFANLSFKTLEQVMNHLSDAVNQLSSQTIKSITGRDWILDMF